MAVPTITSTADISTYVGASITPALSDLITGLGTAIKAANLATAQQQGNPAYSAALGNVERACVDFRNALANDLS